MTCKRCHHQNVKKFGVYGRKRVQRYRCRDCSATFSEPASRPLGSHTIEFDKAVQIVRLLMEGVTIRGISRLTGVHKSTIMALSVTIGQKCLELLDSRIKDIRPRYVQADELHTFVHTKEGHRAWDDPHEWGDCYTWLALDTETKLIIAHHLGKRDTDNAFIFIRALADRVMGRFQLTTDAFSGYFTPVARSFAPDIDYAQLAKMYGKPGDAGPGWYGPSEVIAAIPKPKIGRPDMAHVSTSYVERSNLSVRTSLRRFTRLALGFSKKFENLRATVALYIAWYNFCRVHQTLGKTPAMAAGISDRVWTIEQLLKTA
jgi:transposase-like protein/IS1 family transposase